MRILPAISRFTHPRHASLHATRIASLKIPTRPLIPEERRANPRCLFAGILHLLRSSVDRDDDVEGDDRREASRRDRRR